MAGHKPFKGQAQIYILKDEAGLVFYVGCTTRGLEMRLKHHLSEAKVNTALSNPFKNAYIRKCKYRVFIQGIDSVYVDARKRYQAIAQARELERMWISHYEASMAPLTNREVVAKRKMEAVELLTIDNTWKSS